MNNGKTHGIIAIGCTLAVLSVYILIGLLNSQHYKV